MIRDEDVDAAAGPVPVRILKRTLILAALIILLGSMMAVNAGVGAQYMCPRAADPEVVLAWKDYHAGQLSTARRHFEEAVGRCPRHRGGGTGLGFVELREGNTPRAEALFDRVLDGSPDLVDALVGRGIVAWRQDDLARTEAIFERVRRLDPSSHEARRYLALLHPDDTAPARAPVRPPLVLPDTLEYAVRAAGSTFALRAAAGWVPFYVKGIDLGAALPGRHPSQFPDSSTYADWIERMAATGANTVRVYTLHPPAFYGALRAYDLAHPASPLRLIQGTWAEVPPGGSRFDDPAWEGALLRELRSTVDAVHGRADLPRRPGLPARFYTADVSAWTLAYIVGRPWEPAAVAAFDRGHPQLTGWDGRFTRAARVSPMEAWLTKLVDHVAGYETETYRTQRPVAWADWPANDPLHHPTEADTRESALIRVARGEQGVVVPDVADGDDVVSLDASRVVATRRFPAGLFAAYQVYPYYPRFLALDPGLAATESPFGRSSFYGYLVDLKSHFGGLPVLVDEYGLPPSIGVAQLSPQGWHQGGRTEADAAAALGRMTREIAAAGMAGGIAFEWVDEWFKTGWSTKALESPAEDDRRWYNRMDPEEHYGLNAVEPEPRLPGATLAGRAGAWAGVSALYHDQEAGQLRLLADEAYLRVRFRRGSRAVDELMVGFDVVDPARGDFAWPDPGAPPAPVGMEAVVRVRGDSARLLLDAPLLPTAFRTVAPDPSTADARLLDPGPDIASPPPGLFRGRLLREPGRDVLSRANRDGDYGSPRFLIAGRTFGRDSTELAGLGYDQGLLPRGPEPDGLWEADDSVLELRIPWQMLGVGDPSQLQVIEDTTRPGWGVPLSTTRVPGIRVVLATRDGDAWTALPRSGLREDVPLFYWAPWQEPQWRIRPRPAVAALSAAWKDIRFP